MTWVDISGWSVISFFTMSDEDATRVPDQAPGSDLPSTAPKTHGPAQKAPTFPTPSDRLSPETHWELVRALGLAVEANGGPVELKAAAEILKMAESSFPVALPFFVDVGIVQRVGGGKYDVAQAVKDYITAREWNDQNAAHKFRAHFIDKWFSKALLPRLRLRPYTVSEACAVLAEAAGGASKHFIARFERLLWYMDFVGVAKLEGSEVRAVMDTDPPGGAAADVGGGAGSSGGSTGDAGGGNGNTGGENRIELPEQAESFWLDQQTRKRKFTIIPPAEGEISKKDLNRIKKWLDLLYKDVEDDGEEDNQQST
jgi:hypothetical protein